MLNSSAGWALEANPKPVLLEAARAGGHPVVGNAPALSTEGALSPARTALRE